VVEGGGWAVSRKMILRKLLKETIRCRKLQLIALCFMLLLL
jgi:hypothetical protein